MKVEKRDCYAQTNEDFAKRMYQLEQELLDKD